MSDEKLAVRFEDEHYVVGNKVFYTKAAAETYAEERGERARMSNGTKIFLVVVVVIGGYFLFAPMVDSFGAERHTDKFIEGAIKGLLFTPVIALLFWAPKKIRKIIKDRKDISGLRDDAYETALNEIETGQVIKKIWAKAYSLADGDDAKARAVYLKLRAVELSKL